ncbi:hypothetical protein SHD_3940 [Shewanella decolorationis S12]|uniref:Uncharacterized protein n=2 Tax=Shewanella decolorationis TaxID=256839 RepID=A0A8A9LGM1_9GAMM|nr:hypothetical protein SHD_3940 [Shewanella decolorationis S12]
MKKQGADHALTLLFYFLQNSKHHQLQPQSRQILPALNRISIKNNRENKD